MNLETDQLVMITVVCAVVYIAGYHSLAISMFILMILSSLIMRKKTTTKKVSTSGINIKGAEMLEPIIIETTRGPPFRIPASMQVRIKPNWASKTWLEKACIGIGRITRMAYRATKWSDYQ